MKPEMPKDLGVKIGSPREVIWTAVKVSLKNQIKQAEDGLLVNKRLLITAERMITEEQRKAKV